MNFYTFFIYTFLMFFCIIMSCKLTHPIQGKKQFYNNLMYTNIIILVYTLIVGLRYNVGVDYQNYYEWYRTLYITDKFPVEDADIGYYLLNRLTKYFNIHYCFIFIVLAFGLIFSLLKAVKFTKFLYPLYFFFFFCIIFNESLNVMRQIMAFYIWYYAYILYLEKKIKTALIVAFIGFLFHKSSILALLWFPFLYVDICKNRFLTIAIVLISFILGEVFYENIKVILTLGSAIGGRLGVILTEEKLNQFEEFTAGVESQGIAVIIYLCINIIIIYFSKELRNKYKDYKFSFFYNLYIVGQILNPIAMSNTMMIRANYYFDLHKILILSFFVFYYWKNKSKKYIIPRLLTIIILLIYLFLHYRHIINSQTINPYQTIFSI